MCSIWNVGVAGWHLATAKDISLGLSFCGWRLPSKCRYYEIRIRYLIALLFFPLLHSSTPGYKYLLRA
jgi:hypothetical protein